MSVVMNGIRHTKPLAQLQAHGSNNYHLYDASSPAVTSLSLRKSVVCFEFSHTAPLALSQPAALSLHRGHWIEKKGSYPFMCANFKIQFEFIHFSL